VETMASYGFTKTTLSLGHSVIVARPPKQRLEHISLTLIALTTRATQRSHRRALASYCHPACLFLLLRADSSLELRYFRV
jgi:hypothetical protein